MSAEDLAQIQMRFCPMAAPSKTAAIISAKVSLKIAECPVAVLIPKGRILRWATRTMPKDVHEKILVRFNLGLLRCIAR